VGLSRPQVLDQVAELKTARPAWRVNAEAPDAADGADAIVAVWAALPRGAGAGARQTPSWLRNWANLSL
jgi:hypothetical protein